MSEVGFLILLTLFSCNPIVFRDVVGDGGESLQVSDYGFYSGVFVRSKPFRGSRLQLRSSGRKISTSAGRTAAAMNQDHQQHLPEGQKFTLTDVVNTNF